MTPEAIALSKHPPTNQFLCLVASAALTELRDEDPRPAKTIEEMVDRLDSPIDAIEIEIAKRKPSDKRIDDLLWRLIAEALRALDDRTGSRRHESSRRSPALREIVRAGRRSFPASADAYARFPHRE
jgi:hypothetical protein